MDFESLSERELQILRLLAEGLSNQEIADHLFLSLETIKWYNREIYSKLGVNSRTRAVALAGERQIFEQPSATGFSPPPHHNLPVQVTSFIGREQEIEVARQLLLAHRLVTFTGPGGTGKTRLSLQTAGQLLAHFPDGVWFVNLAPVSDPSALAQTVVEALGIAAGSSTFSEAVKQHFKNKHTLIVLDNFEQILSAGSVLVEWLVASPKLHLLVTSREVLRVYGEQEYPVPPLALPVVDLRESLVETVARYEAVRLFTERAKAVQPHFELTYDNVPVVAAICTQLDGLPLAIELAAVRIKLFTPQNLLRRLESRLSVLTEGARDLPARQQTLRAMIDWSYNLLTPAEQQLFSLLAVFHEGWTIDAAEGVWNKAGYKRINLLDGLSSLLNKSLIRSVESEEPRFTMLETLREYALDKLCETGQRDITRRAHAAYFHDYVTYDAPGFPFSEEQLWSNRFTADHNNLRAAIDYFHEQPDGAQAEMHITGALGYFWFANSHLKEGAARTEAALERDDESLSPIVRAKAYNAAGYCDFALGNHVLAKARHAKAMDIYRVLNDRYGIAWTTTCLSAQYSSLGKPQQALAYTEEGITIARELNDRYLLVYISINHAINLRHSGLHMEAKLVLEEGISLARELNALGSLNYLIGNYANVLVFLGEYEQARPYFLETIELARKLNDGRLVCSGLINFAYLSLSMGIFDGIVQYGEEALTIAREIGDHSGVIEALVLLSLIAENAGGSELAEKYAREALQHCQFTDALITHISALQQMVILAVNRCLYYQAKCLLSLITGYGGTVSSEEAGYSAEKYTAAMNEMHKYLTDEELAAAQAEGAVMTIAEGIDYAMRLFPSF